MSKQKNNNQRQNTSRKNSRVKNINTKKRKLNSKKIVLLLAILTVLSFGFNKAAIGISTMVKGSDKATDQVSKEVAAEEVDNSQFEMEDENSNLDDKYVVVIDPGHGGNDPGNIGYSTKNKTSEKDILEKDIALEVSKKVASILSKQKDVQVRLTRSDDKFVSLEERAKIANTAKADAFISIHMNAESGGDSAYGIETYYKPKATDNSKELAQILQDTVGSYVEIRDRGIKEEIFQVLIDSNMPGALIECGFMSNQKEEQKLLDAQYQDKLAEGIAQGILTFLDEYIK